MTYRVSMAWWLEHESPGIWELPLVGLLNALLDFRRRLRATGDYATADRMRVMLREAGVEVSDTKDGAYWRLT